MKAYISFVVFALSLTAAKAVPTETPYNTTVVTNETPIDGDKIHGAQALADLLTAVKRIMPCGDPALGMPVLAPYRMDEFQLNINDDLLVLKGDMKNLIMTGINDFMIIELVGNSSTNRTTFDLLYKGFQMLADVDININADLAGFQFVQHLKGFVDMQVMNVRLTGGMTIGTNDVGGMSFSNMDYNVQVGDIISEGLNLEWSVATNNFVNKYLGDSSLLFLQTHREFLNKKISGYITPLLNRTFFNITSSQYLQAMIDATDMYNSIECSH